MNEKCTLKKHFVSDKKTWENILSFDKKDEKTFCGRQIIMLNWKMQKKLRKFFMVSTK